MRSRAFTTKRRVALALALVVCAIGLGSANTAQGQDTPTLPPAGQIPPRAHCDPENLRDFRDPRLSETCRLIRDCDDPRYVNQRVLQRRCAELRERELLRECQLDVNTRPDCTDQTERLKERCAAVDPNSTDDATCWEFNHKREPGAVDQPGPDPRSPATADPPSDFDVLGGNGGVSPWCRRSGLDPTSQEYCRSSGSITQEHMLAAYGLDSWIDGRPVVGDPIPSALQGLVKWWWKLLLWLTKSILLMLEWAFSIELISEAMPDLEVGLRFMHEKVLGSSWMTAGIAIAGLWGIWNGFVRQRTVQTFSGLAGVVLLMVVALTITYNPRGTIGALTRWTNESAVQALGVASNGTVSDPSKAFGQTQRGMFADIVEGPWCVLQFGNKNYCTVKDDKGVTVADAWLSTPAGSKDRRDLYDKLKSSNKLQDSGRGGCRWDRQVLDVILSLGSSTTKLKCDELRREVEKLEKQGLVDKNGWNIVRFQEQEGTTDRMALLCLVALGLLGAVFLFGWLALHLIFASTHTTVLVFAAPFMLIAPAFGDGGRKFFVTWLKRLGGAVVSKFVFALLLAVAVFVSNMIGALNLGGWTPQWLLWSAFWWGCFLKRQQILQVAYFGDRGEANSGLMHLASAYLGFRFAGDIARGVRGAVRTTGRGAIRGGRWGYGVHQRYRAGRDQSIAEDHKRQLDEEARGAAEQRLTGDRDGAQARMKAQEDRKRRHRTGTRQLDDNKRMAQRWDQKLEKAEQDFQAAGRAYDASLDAAGNPTEHSIEPAHRMNEAHDRKEKGSQSLHNLADNRDRRAQLLDALQDDIDQHEPDAAAARSMVSRLGTGGNARVSASDVNEQIDMWRGQLAGADPASLPPDQRRMARMLQASQGGEYVTRGIRQAAMDELLEGPAQYDFERYRDYSRTDRAARRRYRQRRRGIPR